MLRSQWSPQSRREGLRQVPWMTGNWKGGDSGENWGAGGVKLFDQQRREVVAGKRCMKLVLMEKRKEVK